MSLVRPPPSSAQLVHHDGEPMESARHVEQMHVLVHSLEIAWAHRNDFHVGGNQFLYFSETQSRRNDFRGPDVFVVLHTERRERKSWVVWEEDGKAPDVIIELLSESTEHVDRNDKMRLYAQVLKVGEYFLFDPWSGVLEGYTLNAARGAYVQKPYDERGRVYCEQVGFWLGTRESLLHGIRFPWLRWMDEDGTVKPVGEELAHLAREQARAAEEAKRAAEEAKRAAEEATLAAEARAAQLEAELRALRARLGE